MSNQVKQIIRQTVSEMLADSMSAQNVRRMAEKHAEKVHFVPIRYRIIGGILQGLNIKFGNFIEQLLRNIVEMDTGVQVMPDSGKKIRLFFTPETDALIDGYITERHIHSLWGTSSLVVIPRQRCRAGTHRICCRSIRGNHVRT